MYMTSFMETERYGFLAPYRQLIQIYLEQLY